MDIPMDLNLPADIGAQQAEVRPYQMNIWEAIKRAPNDFEKLQNLITENNIINIDQLALVDGSNITPFIWAAKSNDINLVHFLLDHGADINQQDSLNKFTALMYAVSCANEDMMKLLVERGANVNISGRQLGVNYEGCQTAFNLAMEKSLWDFARYLYLHGAKIKEGYHSCFLKMYNFKDKQAEAMPYHIDIWDAFDISRGDLEKLKKLVVKNNITDLDKPIDKLGQTLLMKVAEEKFIVLVDFLIDSGANINQQDSVGRTALMYVVSLRFNEEIKYHVIELLVEGGADLNIKSYDQQTAFNIAIEKHDWDIAKYFYLHGAKIEPRHLWFYKMIGVDYNSQDGNNDFKSAEIKPYKLDIWDAIYFAQNDLEKLNRLIQEYNITNFCEPKKSEFMGGTPLMSAVREGNVDLAGFLLAKGVNINQVGMCGYTAIMEASMSGNIDMVRWLIQRGADVNIRVHDSGITALRLAEMEHNAEIVQLLTQHGALGGQQANNLNKHRVMKGL